MASERRDGPRESGEQRSEKRRRRKKHRPRQDVGLPDELHRRSSVAREPRQDLDISGDEPEVAEDRDRSMSHHRSRRHGHSDPERRRRKSRKHRSEEDPRRDRTHHGNSTRHRRVAGDEEHGEDSSSSSDESERGKCDNYCQPGPSGIDRNVKRHTIHGSAPSRGNSHSTRAADPNEEDGSGRRSERPVSIRRSNTVATHRRSQSMLSALFTGPAPKPTVRRRVTVTPTPAGIREETDLPEGRSPSPKPSVASRRSVSAMPKKSPRKVSIWEAFMGPPPAPATPKEVQLVECIICLSDDIPSNKSVKLACSHRMCHACIKRSFVLSTTDPAHMPPKCCADEHIPLQKVERLFTDKFKRIWNKKYAEYTTKNRLYCPQKGCGEWIPPTSIKLDSAVGRRYGTCKKCKAKACKKCGLKWHGNKDCSNDAETQRVLELGEESGWKRCYSCKALVQLGEGCNHMKCRCTAEFCMVCGKRWKTCDCPLFPVPPDTAGLGFGGDFDPMRFVEVFHQERRMDPFLELFPELRRRRDERQARNNVGRREEPAPALVPPPPMPPPTPLRDWRNRRAQEDADEALARQLQEAEISGRAALNGAALNHTITNANPRPRNVNPPGVLFEFLNGRWSPIPERPRNALHPPSPVVPQPPPPPPQALPLRSFHQQQARPPPMPPVLATSPTQERTDFWDVHGRSRLRREEREARAAERAASAGGEAELAGLDGRRSGILRVEGWRRGIE